MSPKMIEFPTVAVRKESTDSRKSRRRRPNACCPENRPDPRAIPEPIDTGFPSPGRLGENLVGSAIAFLADGGRWVDGATYRKRLAACDRCPHLRGRRCLLCGCYLPIKARGRAFRCPENRWRT